MTDSGSARTVRAGPVHGSRLSADELACVPHRDESDAHATAITTAMVRYIAPFVAEDQWDDWLDRLFAVSRNPWDGPRRLVDESYVAHVWLEIAPYVPLTWARQGVRDIVGTCYSGRENVLNYGCSALRALLCRIGELDPDPQSELLAYLFDAPVARRSELLCRIAASADLVADRCGADGLFALWQGVSRVGEWIP
jgi:hypothetical protein